MTRLLLTSLLGLAAWAGCGDPCGPTSGVVTHVVDGDTIDLEDGTRVRYLQIDTPEITNGKSDCWGAEARDANRALVIGKTVELSYDVECNDRFGRLLAYVTADGVDVNRSLVAQGNACVLIIAPNGQARKAEFEELELIARNERSGMWGSCSEVTCN